MPMPPRQSRISFSSAYYDRITSAPEPCELVYGEFEITKFHFMKNNELLCECHYDDLDWKPERLDKMIFSGTTYVVDNATFNFDDHIIIVHLM